MDTEEIEKRDLELLNRVKKITGQKAVIRGSRKKATIILATFALLFLSFIIYEKIRGGITPNSVDSGISVVEIEKIPPKMQESSPQKANPVTPSNGTPSYKISAKPKLPVEEITLAKPDQKESVAPSKNAISLENKNTQPSKSLKNTSRDIYVSDIALCREILQRNPLGRKINFSLQKDRYAVLWTEIKSKKFPTEIKHVYYFKDKKYFEIGLSISHERTRTWSKVTRKI